MEQLHNEFAIAEHSVALRSVRAAKFLWSILIVLALLMHIAAFVLVEFVGVLDEKAPKEEPTAKPANAPSLRAVIGPAP